MCRCRAGQEGAIYHQHDGANFARLVGAFFDHVLLIKF